MHMKRPFLGLLCATVALTSCQTAHRAAVSTFRVIDAPHEYMRRQLDLDEQGNEPPADASTTTTTTYSQTNAPGYNQTSQQPYQQQAPPPQYSQQRRVVENNPPPPQQRQVVTERTRQDEAPRSTPTPAPRVTSRTTTNSNNSADSSSTSTKTTARTSSTSAGSLPYAKPVPGKAGYVFSPYDKNGGYVDVTGFAPGSKVKDPYSGKVFLVP